LIQVFTRTRNTDSKVRTSRFVSFKFEFHSSAAATFATISPSKADVRADVPVGRVRANCGQRHRSKTASLFDDLVGACEQRRRHVKTESLSSLDVDHQFEFGRLLNWQIAWLGTLENFIDVASGTPI
jgi:hypothetical protein